MIQLVSQNVDNAVIVSAIWLNGSNGWEIISSPYLTNLTFQPLATNSSGMYVLTVSVRSSDNSPYIVENNRSVAYNLVVRCKFAQNMYSDYYGASVLLLL